MCMGYRDGKLQICPLHQATSILRVRLPLLGIRLLNRKETEYILDSSHDWRKGCSYHCLRAGNPGGVITRKPYSVGGPNVRMTRRSSTWPTSLDPCIVLELYLIAHYLNSACHYQRWVMSASHERPGFLYDIDTFQ